jgi:broad specificity phosphatase PhoE
MEKIILVRHGQTNTNVRGVMHAVKDEEVLNEEGKRQMAKVAEDLEYLKPTKIYTSNEKRTKESGDIIAKKFGIPLETLEDIGERNWGDFVGQPWSEVEKILKPMSIEQRYLYTPPNGESWKTFETRLIQAINKIIKENPNQTAAFNHTNGKFSEQI